MLDDSFITLGNLCLEEVYKLKITAQPHKVAVMRLGNDLKEGGIIACTDEATVVPIIQDQVFNMLSDFHFYCHEKQQQNEQLNREAADNALGLQQVLRE